MKAKTLLTLVLVLVCMIAVSVNSECATTQIPVLGGSWIVHVHPKGFPSFTNMSTFTSDGGLVNTTDVLSASVGHGAWSRVGARQFAITILDYLYDEKGNTAGSEKVRSTITLNGTSDKFYGPFTVEGFDNQGKMIYSVSGTVNATRIVAERLQ